MELKIEECIKVTELEKSLNKNNINDVKRLNGIVYLFDENNQIIYQKRGLKCRDKRLKLEGIGGGFDKGDITIKDGILREVKEEAGSNCKISIDKYLGTLIETTYDCNELVYKKILIVGYMGRLVSGKLEIMEPGKCLGYEKYRIDEIDKNELSSSALFFYEKILNERSF